MTLQRFRTLDMLKRLPKPSSSPGNPHLTDPDASNASRHDTSYGLLLPKPWESGSLLPVGLMLGA